MARGCWRPWKRQDASRFQSCEDASGADGNRSRSPVPGVLHYVLKAVWFPLKLLSSFVELIVDQGKVRFYAANANTIVTQRFAKISEHRVVVVAHSENFIAWHAQIFT